MLVRDIFNMISNLTEALQATEVTVRAELYWKLLQRKRKSTFFLGEPSSVKEIVFAAAATFWKVFERKK